MKYGTLVALFALLAACGGDENNGAGTNNGTAGTNNGAATNNGTAGSNNGTTATNNGTAATNNGTAATNNGTAGTNNGAPVADHITALIDGVEVVADAPEGGVEPMDTNIQLRKTTGEESSPVQIFRITIPNTDVASYDCATDDVLVMYSELNGQIIANWASSDTCTIEVSQGGTEAGDVIVGTFTATTSDGNSTVEITAGEFSLTR